MAQPILLKRSSVAGKVPLTANLQYGELSINYTDGALYYLTSQNTVNSFLSNGSSFTANVITSNNEIISGNITAGSTTSLHRFIGNVGIGPSLNPADLDSALTISLNSAPPIVDPSNIIHVAAADEKSARVTLDTYGNTQFLTSSIIGRRSRGTAANPAPVSADDAIMQIGARGYGTSMFSSNTKAYISLNASENWTDYAHGTYISFGITPPGSTLTYKPVEIAATGNLVLSNGVPSGGPLTGALIVSGTGGIGVGGNINAAGTIAAGNLSVSGTIKDATGNVGLNGQVLVSTGSGTQWITKNTGSLSSLSDVNLSSPKTQQVLTYNGTQWVNADSNATVASAVFASSQTDMGLVNDAILTVSEDEGSVTEVSNNIYDLGVLSFTGIISLNNIDQSVKSDYLGYSIIFGF